MVGFIERSSEEEKNFYTENVGKAVNLFGDGTTFSGDLICIDLLKGKIVLRNFVERKYSPDGTSCFWENPGEFELDIQKSWGRSTTTKEDRLGRIVNYNRDLIVQEIEQRKKLKDLSSVIS